ncbi:MULTISPECIES: hypothetical protein [unclassified Empedobacter]|uniref:hypothetical protein n=1 Tax=unclassified Empedobacter TaxID=2643773 RepID=UPI00244821ED|nr:MULTISPECIES: hypothetical protein [unclassified Empedobacter]MDH0658594.1 hypothetical protein [Empedobacter sp. GD03865]MDH0674538.1 hypothetical protein [Empedobacter sp. GD03861]
MKKFLINIGLFSLFAIVFYIVVMPLWSSVLPFYMSKNVRSCMGCYGHTFTRMQDAQKIKNVDVLIVGSSHAYRGIDPRVLQKEGISAFNLGSSSQTPINTKVLLHQYLEQINPKIVVYEAYAGTMNIDGVESSLDILSNNKIDINSIKMANEVHNLLAYNTLIFSGFRQTFGLNKRFKEAIQQGDDTYISSTGYVESKFKNNIFNKENYTSWDLRDSQKEELINNIEFIKSKGIDVYIIQAPITKTLYNSINNNKDVDVFLSNLGNYKNYQNLVELRDSTDFYDNNHLNQIGVEKFNAILSKDLKILLKK